MKTKKVPLVLGLELGSTRVKATLIDRCYTPIASGSFSWENRLENGVWTYPLSQAQNAVAGAIDDLFRDLDTKGIEPNIKSIGVSGMMHGYLPFDKDWNQLAPFRTWRNTITSQASLLLSRRFDFNIPQRWSIAHLYQAILNKEDHISGIAHLTTLAGWVHYRLTGVNVLGIGEASGMFPVDPSTGRYYASMVVKFNRILKKEGLSYRIREILPSILPAGKKAGSLTPEGALFLDPKGRIQPGIPFCPPEGDADTGMVATNSITPLTGNVSAGTSIFGMVVLSQPMKSYYPEFDVVASPDGKSVVMVHCNNCTSELNMWVSLFSDFLHRMGRDADLSSIYDTIFHSAMETESDCGGVTSLPFLSGEHFFGLEEGFPALFHAGDKQFSFPSFCRAQLWGAVATLAAGFNYLNQVEGIKPSSLLGHGGFFKTPDVGQALLAAALNTPIAVMETAGEGGPWGMALLSAYMLWGKGQTLSDFLNNQVFASVHSSIVYPSASLVQDFHAYAADFAQAVETALYAQNYIIHREGEDSLAF